MKKIILPLILVIAAVGIAYALIATKPEAPRATPQKVVPQVDVYVAKRGSTPLLIESIGTIIPSQSVSIKAEVGGTVERVTDEFTPGAITKKGTLLIRLDKTDYETDVLKKEAAVAQQQANYDLELGRQDVARKEYEQMKEILPNMAELQELENNLALRVPQLAQAKAALDSAKADLLISQNNLADTEVRAPFAGLILDRTVSTGQQLTTNDVITQLVAIDEYWVEVSLAVDTLYNNNIITAQAGDPVEIITRSGEVWTGELMQFVSALEENSRMGRMLVRVDDPMALSATNEKAPLLMNDQVDVTLEAGIFDDIFAVPRIAVYNNTHVWIVEDNELYKANIDVVWKNADTVFIRSSEIPDEALFLVSGLANPVEDIKVRPVIVNED